MITERKKIVALYFSPREPSNSAELLDIALKPLEKKGFSIERIFIRNLDINPCDDCQNCYNGAPCPIEDDIPHILDLLENSSSIAIATPVYFYGVPAKAKALIDRCQVFWARKYKLANPLPEGRQAGIIITAESGGQKVAEGLRLTLRYFLDVLSIDMPEMHVVRNCYWEPNDAPSSEIKKAEEYGMAFLERIEKNV